MKAELLKFLNFVDKKTDWKVNMDTTNQMVVDAYFNHSDAQSESRSVSDHEAKKEFTQKLLNKIQEIDPEYVYIVNNEFWNLFE